MELIIYKLIGCILFLVGNSIAIAYSIDLLAISLKRRSLDSITKIIFFVFVNIVCIIIIYNFYDTNIIKNGIVVYYIAYFCFGVLITKRSWKHLDNVECSLNNEIQSIFNLITKKSFNYYKDIDTELGKVKSEEDLINYMKQFCIDAGVDNIPVKLYDEMDINGGMEYNVKTRKPTAIALTKGCLRLNIRMIAAIMGHEIAHLKNKDYRKESLLIFKLYLTGTLIFVLYLECMDILTYLMPTIGNIISIITFPFILVYFVGMLFYYNVNGKRYLYQIQEIRADRVGCEMKGVTKDGMLELLYSLKESNCWFYKLKWYKRIYIRYFELVEHPCIDYRIKLIKNYRKWSMIDYFKHALQVIKWFFTGKGWIGM